MASARIECGNILSDIELKQRRRISQRTAVPADFATVSVRLRKTKLGQLYFNHLKKYAIIQLMAPWIWRKAYLLYQAGWILCKAQKFPLVRLSIYAAPSEKVSLSPAETVITPFPDAYPKDGKEHRNSLHTSYEFPIIYIARLHNATVTGATNLVMTDDSVVCHDLYDFAHDYTSEELNGRTFIWPYRERIAWLMHTTSSHEFERAACFTDACAHNYAHWMTEVLPRINLFCQTEASQKVPLIVDDGLHRNLMESLRTVVGDKREFVTLPAGATALVRHLSTTSVTGYVPFERRSNRLKNHSHGRFSPFALQSLRKCLQERQGVQTDSPMRRVFIKRNSGIRNIANGKQIEKLLIDLGFFVVEPEFLTHAQQIELFSNAEVLVGATGAAMANLIFCKPSTKIVIMISDYKFMPYGYWQNMACAVGNKVTYVLGRCMGAITHLHSDFEVAVPDLIDAID
jgi:capsular polysaccharide biosynthesis protein